MKKCVTDRKDCVMTEVSDMYKRNIEHQKPVPILRASQYAYDMIHNYLNGFNEECLMNIHMDRNILLHIIK